MASSTRPAPPARPRKEPRRTYVLDTSVLLADPRALIRFAEHEVVLPVVVITELEAKRHHPELGYFARTALRMLDDLRIQPAASTSRCPSATTAARCGSSSTTPTPRRCPPGSGWATTTPASWRWRATSPPRAATSPGLQGPADARQGLGVRPRGRGVPRRARRRVRLDRHGRARRHRRGAGPAVRDGRLETSRRAELPCHTGLVLLSARLRAWAGSAPTSRCGWCAATARRSACTAAAPSSASRSTCCSTPRSASSPSAAGPAPASRPWPCAPASRRCWSAASTARSWSSARCSPSAARSSATCPVTRPRR